MAGLLTREEVGPRYDEYIGELAYRSALRNFTAGSGRSVAELCGFADEAEIRSALESRTHLRPQLDALIHEGEELAASIRAHVALAWANPRRLECWDPEQPHDGQEWVRTHGVDGAPGVMRFTTSTRCGDRAFRLHFTSADFPELNDAIVAMDGLQREYWEAVRRANR